MQLSQKFQLHQQTFWLSPERCIYWQDEKTIIMSDLHLGKTGHFRKSGIAVPQSVFKEDLQRLLHQLTYFKPERLLVVGDFFHSTANKEMALFEKWRNDFSQLDITLIRGNHDILKSNWYSNTSINVVENHLLVNKFCFVHDMAHACEPTNDIDYYFSGHIHPCITIKSLGRQSLQFPCFYFTSNYAVLPAFGKFTGTAHIKPKAKDKVFAILPANANNKEQASVVEMF